MPKVYIEREAANEFVCQLCDTSCGTFCVRCDGNPLKSIPAADVVERKKTAWAFRKPSNVCPNCGAKMEGSE